MMNDEDLISEAKEFFEESSSYEEENWRPYWLDDLRFRALDQWTQEAINARNMPGPGEPRRPCLVLDQTDQYVRQVINDARLSPPALRAVPVDDKADVEVAEKLQSFFRYIESVSRAQSAYITALDWAATCGRGFFRLSAEQTDEYRNLWEPRISRVANAMHVYFDPHSIEIDGSDATDAMMVVEMSRKAFARKYGKDTKTSEWIGGHDDWINKDSVRIAEWHSVREESTLMVVTADGMMTPEVAAKRELINFREEKVKHKVARVRKITGAEVLEDTVFLGGGIGLIPVYGTERYTGDKRELFGIIRAAKDPQRMLNYLASNFAEAVNGATRAPWVIPDEAVSGFEPFWNRANQAALPYLPYNPFNADGQALPAPSRQAVDINLMGYQNAMMGMQGMLQSSIGMYQASIGAPGQEKSGIAIRERSQQSDVSTYHYIANMGSSIEYCGRMIMKMIPEMYDVARVQKILGEDGQTEQVMIDPSSQQPMAKGEVEGKPIDILNPLIGEYDIQIRIGPSFTSRREAAAQAIGDAMNRNPALMQMAGDIFFRNQDWPGADDLADRMKLMLPPEVKAANEDDEIPPEVTAVVGQVMQAVQMRDQQMQQGMQALQKLVDDMKQAKQEMQLQKAQLQVEGTKLDAAQQRFDMQVSAAQQQLTHQAEKQSMIDESQASEGDRQSNLQPLLETLTMAVAQMAQPKAVEIVRDENGRAAGAVVRQG